MGLLLKMIGWALIVVGQLGFGGLFWPRIFAVPTDIELPLSDSPPAQAVIAPSGEAFVLHNLMRMQKYSADGVFEGAWSVNPGGGLVSFNLLNGHLVVCSTRYPEPELYTLAGEAVTDWDGPAPTRADCTAEGAQATVERGGGGWTLRPTAGGPAITIERKWWHYLMFSMPAVFATILLGFALVWAGSRLRRQS